MSHDQVQCGCDEYLQLSRRGFVGLSGAALAAAATAPAWLPRVSFASNFNTPPQDVVVAIFLRGGCDGLNVVIPYNDPGYTYVNGSIATRNVLKVSAPDDTSVAQGFRALALGGATYGSVNLGLHPAMAALKPAYDDGKLLIAHCTGLTGTNKSHFDAQKFMEIGKFNDSSLLTGWLGRHLQTADPMNPNSILRAVGIADGLQRSLIGSPLSLPIPDLQNNPGAAPALNNFTGYGLSGTSTTKNARRQVLHRISTDPGTTPAGMYENADTLIRLAAQNTVNTIQRLNNIGAGGYAPAGGAVYPSNTLGYALRSTAALIAANDLTSSGQAVDAVAIDYGSWDTHTNEVLRDNTNGVFTGSMVNLMTTLSQALGAFYQDLMVSRGKNVTVVIMSEFGRRVGENGGAAGAGPGTDHGYGNFCMVLGPQVLGGRVIAKASAAAAGFGWPGVPRPGFNGVSGTTLPQNLDMPITLDYRHILAEIVSKRLNNGGNLASIFPGFTPQFQGVFA